MSKTRFSSSYLGLMTDVVVDGKSQIIRFENGVYDTDDPEVILQLRKKAEVWEIGEKDDFTIKKEALSVPRKRIIITKAVSTEDSPASNPVQE